VSKWIGGATAALVLVGMVLWGVPWYLKGQVADLYAAEVAASVLIAPDENATENAATIGAIQQQLTSMENRMIKRDEFFMAYLERQANKE
jgi:hypothetical protein